MGQTFEMTGGVEPIIRAIPMQRLGREGAPVQELSVHWTYDADQPYELSISLPTDNEQELNIWQISREAVREVTYGVPREESSKVPDFEKPVRAIKLDLGDIQLFTTPRLFYFVLRLSSPDAVALYRIQKSNMIPLLTESYRLVPFGAEEAIVARNIEYDLLQLPEPDF